LSLEALQTFCGVLFTVTCIVVMIAG